MIAGLFLTNAAVAAVAIPVAFEDAAPSCPAWTYYDDGNRLTQDMRTIDGERALCVSNPTNAPGAYLAWAVVSRPFDVVAGKDLEIAVRLISPAAEFGGGSYGVYRTGVVWLGADGKEVAFKGLNFPSREPQLLTFISRAPVPAKAVRARLSFGFGYSKFPPDAIFALSSARARLVDRDAKGPDDPAFEATDVPRLVRVTASPCEDVNASFRVRVVAKNPIDWGAFACTLDGAPSDRIRREGNEILVRPPKGGWANPSFPVVRVSGRDVRGTRFADEQTFCFGRRLKKHVASLRDDGVVLVDGKPFFPIGVYCPSRRDPDHEDDVYANFYDPMRELKAVGCNTVQNYHAIGERAIEVFLTAADWAGLKVFIAPGRNVDDTNVAETVYRMREHPSLLAWYVADDTASHISVRRLRQQVERVKAVDGIHLTAQSDSVVFQDLTRSRYARYAGITDVFIPQLYPVEKAETTHREIPSAHRDLDAYAADMRAAGSPNVSLWPVLQAFSGFDNWKRHPTAAEQRALTWLSVARGARGVIWWTYCSWGNHGIANTPEIWDGFTNVVRELNVVKDDLVTRDAKTQPKAEIVRGEPCDELGYPAVTVLLKEGVRGPLLVAVNASSRPVTARIPLGGGTSAKSLFEPAPRHLSLDGGALTDDFPPLGVRVYRCESRSCQ